MPINGKNIIDKLRNDLYHPINKRISAKARQAVATSMARGGTKTARTLMRTVPAVAGVSVLGGYIGGRVHGAIKRKKKLALEQSYQQQQYEGLGGGGESVATVGEGPVMVRRGPRKIRTVKSILNDIEKMLPRMDRASLATFAGRKPMAHLINRLKARALQAHKIGYKNVNRRALVGKVLQDINDMLKSFNPDARRSFKVHPSGKKNIKLPASVAGKTLFPDAPTDKHKQQTAPGNKGSGVSDLELWQKQNHPGLRKLVYQDYDYARKRLESIYNDLMDHKRDKTIPIPQRIKDISSKVAEAERLVSKIEDFFPESSGGPLGDENDESKYEEDLALGVNESDEIQRWVDRIHGITHDLGIRL